MLLCLSRACSAGVCAAESEEKVSHPVPVESGGIIGRDRDKLLGGKCGSCTVSDTLPVTCVLLPLAA